MHKVIYVCKGYLYNVILYSYVLRIYEGACKLVMYLRLKINKLQVLSHRLQAGDGLLLSHQILNCD